METVELIPLSKSVKKTLELPGSKSHTNRALIMASLCGGKSVIKNISKSNDSLIVLQVLRRLGIKINEKKSNVIIHGNAGIFPRIHETFNIGDAGTAMRFLTSLCTLVPGEIILDGSERMRQRTIADLVEALIKLGAQIEYLQKNGFPPLKINGGTIQGGSVSIKGNVSSQFISSLLMIGPLLKNGLVLNVIGDQVSKSYIDMTIDGLKQFGIKVENTYFKIYRVEKNQKYIPATISIEGDASGASYFFGIAAVTGSTIKVKNINPNSSQGDAKFPDILNKMGCRVIKNIKEQSIQIKGPKQLRGITVNMESMPDTAQTLSVIASFAKGKTHITGLSTLPIKETNRLMALHMELSKMGILTAYDNSSITIQGGLSKDAVIETYNDHRMAMSFAIAGARIPGIQIKNPDVVQKSFPDFWDKIKSTGIKIKYI